MNKLTLVALACATLTVTSCKSVYVEQTASTTDFNANVVQVPTVADLEVQPQRVAATASWNWKLIDHTSTKQRKENLIYDIVNEKNADVLVEPQVRLTKKLFGKRTLVISGYPAKYKNFRKATEADLKAICMANGKSSDCPQLIGEKGQIARSGEKAPHAAPVKASTDAPAAKPIVEKDSKPQTIKEDLAKKPETKKAVAKKAPKKKVAKKRKK